MKLAKEFNKLKKIIKDVGYLHAEKYINEYYESTKNESAILYKARLEFLKENFNYAIEIIVKDYIHFYGKNNTIIYFLALCYLEQNNYEKTYEILNNFDFEKDHIRREEVQALKLFLEKKLNKPYSLEIDEKSYLHNQVINYDNEKVAMYNYNNNLIEFNVDEDELTRIINSVSINLNKITPETSLDMFDKYYFYYPNIGNVNNHKSNIFVVKALRNTQEILFIQPTLLKTKSFVHNYGSISHNKAPEYIEEDLKREVEVNGLFASESLINWLFNKFPYIKSVVRYKLELECALGNNEKALEIIEEYYIPTFGFESSIYFFNINLLCNLERYHEAYRLLCKKKMESFYDEESMRKYRRLKLYLSKILGTENNIQPENYIERQIANYDVMNAIDFIIDINQNLEDKQYKLNLEEELTEEFLFDLFVKLDDKLPHKMKTYRDNICDSYYFRKPNIGINENDGSKTNVFCVMTLKNTKDIIAIYPVNEKNWYRVNEVDYQSVRLRKNFYINKGKKIGRL